MDFNLNRTLFEKFANKTIDVRICNQDYTSWQKEFEIQDCFVKFFRTIQLKKICFIVSIACINLSTFAFCNREQDTEKKAILAKLFYESEESLTKDLQESIRKKGVLASLDTCRTFSEEKERYIAASYPKLVIRRVSEKSRNPDHLPKDWEGKVFADWKEFASKDTPAFVFSDSSAKSLYFMRPIYVNDPVCLKCHGAAEKISAELKTEIKRRYPEDRSFGYQLGDLIGAYSAAWQRL
ncbi:DUF3365 domain-containing protein [Leptospira semungkisensis]|uniref:DUF3365 domain-containing protein n=1 Tax=Leptospira semungkisensis TaxID=2484985 RepID=A0A4R9FLY5_9LEPT|nr:DUF3365 domain-containing protein [Leptospira semungkisensis]TGJ99681.1 DUF3365 domain-containing protein [Leptospira semungkisensis]